MTGGAALLRARLGVLVIDRGRGRRDRARVPQHDGRGLPADDRDRRARPAYLFDGFVQGDFGATFGGGCPPPVAAGHSRQAVRELSAGRDRRPAAPAGADRPPAAARRLLLGTLAGVWGGRRCAMRPRSFSARVLHVATAFHALLPALLPRVPDPDLLRRRQRHRCSSSRSSSGVIDYTPFSDEPAAVPEGDVGAVAAVRAPARGVRAAAHREHAARGAAGGLRAHGARQGPHRRPRGQPPRAPGHHARDRRR